MKVLITGGSGFIGTNLMEFYIKSGADVLNIDIVQPRNFSHRHYWRNLDINAFDDLRKLVLEFDPDYCFHLAARTDLMGENISDYATNIDGVRNLAICLEECENLKLAVFFSSMLVCKIGYTPKDFGEYCPSTFYGRSKVIGEEIVREYCSNHFPWVILRPTSIWGPWFGEPYKNFFTAISKNMYFHPGSASIKRSYGFVLNTIHQLSMVQRCNGGSLVHKTSYIGDYEPIDLLSWAQSIQKELGSRKIRRVPIIFLRLAARLGDLFHKANFKSFPITTFRLNNMLTQAIFDMSTLLDLTGALPYSYQDGVKITCDWMRDVEKFNLEKF